MPDSKEHEDRYIHLPHFLKFKKMNKDLMSNYRSILWTHVYERETRADAQFARLFELLIPGFATKDEAINCMEQFSEVLIKEGMIADCSLHQRQSVGSHSLISLGKTKDEIKQNHVTDYTGFVMCTLRDYKNGIFINKNREWNDRKKMEFWRKEWVKILAKLVNNTSQNNKEIWDEKLTIYSEYESVKKELFNSSAPKLN